MILPSTTPPQMSLQLIPNYYSHIVSSVTITVTEYILKPTTNNWQHSEILRNKVVLQTKTKPKTAATTEKKNQLKIRNTHS